MLRLLVKGGWPVEHRNELEACTCTREMWNSGNYLAAQCTAGQCSRYLLVVVAVRRFPTTIAGDRVEQVQFEAEPWSSRDGEDGWSSSKHGADRQQQVMLRRPPESSRGWRREGTDGKGTEAGKGEGQRFTDQQPEATWVERGRYGDAVTEKRTFEGEARNTQDPRSIKETRKCTEMHLGKAALWMHVRKYCSYRYTRVTDGPRYEQRKERSTNDTCVRAWLSLLRRPGHGSKGRT